MEHAMVIVSPLLRSVKTTLETVIRDSNVGKKNTAINKTLQWYGVSAVNNYMYVLCNSWNSCSFYIMNYGHRENLAINISKDLLDTVMRS